MHSRTRLALILALGAVVTGGLLWTALRPVPVLVDVATAKRGPMQVTLELDGTTRIREIFDVATPITGTWSAPCCCMAKRAGSTILRARSPVAPKTTSASDGPACAAEGAGAAGVIHRPF